MINFSALRSYNSVKKCFWVAYVTFVTNSRKKLHFGVGPCRAAAQITINLHGALRFC